MPSSALRAVLLASLALLASACTAPLQRPWSSDVRRPRSVDMEHYEVYLAIDHRAGHVRGDAELHMTVLGEPVSQVVLDAVELDVTEVRDGAGAGLSFRQDLERLVVELGEPVEPGQELSLQIAWSAFPRNGLYFEGPSRSDPDRPWHVWSQGQTHEARHWLPCWDSPTDRATMRLTLEVDADLSTLSAGVLESSHDLPARGRRADTWALDMSYASYLGTLVVGELVTAELEGPLPLPVVARERDLQAALFATRHTAEMLEVFGRATGTPYPFPKYAQAFVDNFTAGGMENISATTMYDEGLHAPADEPQADISGLVAHELAHQWFGDLITNDGWHELWLNEGFADWLELVWNEHHRGRAETELQARSYQHSGVRAEQRHSRPVVWPEYEDPDDLFDAHSYQGAAARIRLLRSELGEELFDRCLAAYVARHADTLVTTEQFAAVFEEVSGRDLGSFFDEWFHGVGYPMLEGRVGADGRTLELKQTQGANGWRDTFHFGLDVAWSRGGVEHVARVVFDSPSVQLALTGEGDLDWVHLDARSVVPGERWLDQDEAAWARQLTDADDPVARAIAARWFSGDGWVRPSGRAGADTTPGRQALLAAAEDPFWAVRVDVAAALAVDADERAAAALLDLSQDGDPRVRAEAVAGLGLGTLSGDVLVVVRAAADDANSTVAAAAVRALVDHGRPEAWATLNRLLAAESDGAGRLRLARDLVGMLPKLDHEGALPLLVSMAAQHPERWVRASAVSALARMDETRGEVVFRQLCRSLHDEAYGVRRAAARALAADGVDDRDRNHLRARYDLEVHYSVQATLEDLLQ
jgi:aminopeptidase N